MDHSLRERVRSGDPAAFGRLFDEHARTVYRHALRVSGDPSAAEDVVSLTFLEAWRIRKRVLPGDESLLPWLLGITTNVHRNVARSARRHRAALERLHENDVTPDFSHELVERVADSEELRAVRAALGRLRRTDREIFTLCVWSGLDHAATAQALGVPVGTVRSRLSRARARLRELTAEELRKSRSGTQRRDGTGQVQAGRRSAARSTQETAR
ncbi:RNA polymerase sigma factor [Planomonospora parontospora]|uniref:RNA polymerase sigma factor n=1 Tax=Planomonospora parontospora TaxID=58119 RepID=UPI0017802E54|nr:RNA polymerase sigma factor [Planomonospora parontospora]